MVEPLSWCITDVMCSQCSITEATGELVSASAAKSDKIPVILLKTCVEALKVPLYIL